MHICWREGGEKIEGGRRVGGVSEMEEWMEGECREGGR